MATHGKAREVTINNLRNCIPWQRRGFAMSGIEGKFNGTGRMSTETATEYIAAQNVVYTVLSYGTPIAWVTDDGTVTVPNERYSVTTSNHQSLCKVHLNSLKIWA